MCVSTDSQWSPSVGESFSIHRAAVRNTCTHNSLPTRVSVVRYIQVFFPNHPAGEPAAFSIPLAEANEFIKNGAAVSINRGKAIRMKFKPKDVSIRDHSCRMGERVIFLNACGSGYFRSIVMGWADGR